MDERDLSRRSRGRHFSPSLPGDRYLKLGSKSDLRTEISGSIVRYDALAPRPAVLLLSDFVGACAVTLDHIRGENIHIGSTKYNTLLMSYTGASFFTKWIRISVAVEILLEVSKTSREHFNGGENHAHVAK